MRTSNTSCLKALILLLLPNNIFWRILYRVFLESYCLHEFLENIIDTPNLPSCAVVAIKWYWSYNIEPLFGDNHLVLQELWFCYHIILIKIIIYRHGDSLVHSLFLMVWYILFIILLIGWRRNIQFRILASLKLTIKYLCSWGESIIQSF